MMGNTTPGYGSQPPPGSVCEYCGDAPCVCACPYCGGLSDHEFHCRLYEAEDEPDDDAYIPDAPGRW
jgi:hypothetical protein